MISDLPCSTVHIVYMNWGPYWMYPISMTVIMLCVHKLGQYVDNRWALSIMLWIPVIGLVSWQRQILHLDMGYLSPQLGVIHITKLIWQCHHHAWSLLLIGSVFLHFFDKSWAWIMFLTTLCHVVSGFMIEDLVQHISLGRYQSAEWSIWVIESIRWLPCVGIFWMWNQNTLIKRTMVVMFLLVQVWLTAPFVGLLILSAPRTVPTEQNLPTSAAFLGSTVPVATPSSSNFEAQLNAQGNKSCLHRMVQQNADRLARTSKSIRSCWIESNLHI